MDSDNNKQDSLSVGIDFGNTKTTVAVWNPKRKKPELLFNTENNDSKNYFPSVYTLQLDNSPQGELDEGREEDNFNEAQDVNDEDNEFDEGVDEDEEYEPDFGDDDRLPQLEDVLKYSQDTKNQFAPLPEVCVQNLKRAQSQQKVYLEGKPNKAKKEMINNESKSKLNENTNTTIIRDLKLKFGNPDRTPIVNDLTVNELITGMFSSIIDELVKKYEKSIANVVLSVPQDFTSAQRIELKEILKKSGFANINIINESVAAALSYARQTKHAGTENLLIIDMGSSKTEVNVITIGNSKTYKTLSSLVMRDVNGNTFTDELYNYVVRESIEPEYGRKFTLTAEMAEQIRGACERAKSYLYCNEETEIVIENFNNESDIQCSITRESYDELNKDKYDKVHKLVKQAIELSKVPKEKITHAFLLGDALLKNTRLSEELRQEFEDNGVMDDLDISNAIGATMYSAIVSGQMTKDYLKEIKVYNLTPLSLGIKTEGDLMSVVIPRNSRYPTQKKRTFITTEDNQASMTIEVYEGERKLTKHNTRLYKMKLRQLPERFKGEVKVSVVFNIDSDGILVVSAQDAEGNNVKESRSLNIGNYEKETIDMKIREGVMKKNEDTIEKERIQAMLKLNDTIMNYTHQYQGCNTELNQLLEYKTWMKQSARVRKEEYEKKEKELKDQMEMKEYATGRIDNKERSAKHSAKLASAKMSKTSRYASAKPKESPAVDEDGQEEKDIAHEEAREEEVPQEQ